MKKEIQTKQEALAVIASLAEDYSGYRTITGLMNVIDQMADAAKQALELYQ